MSQHFRRHIAGEVAVELLLVFYVLIERAVVQQHQPAVAASYQYVLRRETRVIDAVGVQLLGCLESLRNDVFEKVVARHHRRRVKQHLSQRDKHASFGHERLFRLSLNVVAAWHISYLMVGLYLLVCLVFLPEVFFKEDVVGEFVPDVNHVHEACSGVSFRETAEQGMAKFIFSRVALR